MELNLYFFVLPNTRQSRNKINLLFCLFTLVILFIKMVGKISANCYLYKMENYKYFLIVVSHILIIYLKVLKDINKSCFQIYFFTTLANNKCCIAFVFNCFILFRML